MQIERRITHSLVSYWQQIKGDRRMPAASDVEPEDIPEMWKDCFLIRVSALPNNENIQFSYVYVGDNVRPLFTEAFGERAQLHTLPPERLLQVYQEMQMTHLPVVENVEEYSLGSQIIKFRQCLLPISNGGGVVSEIFGGVRFCYV